MTTAGGTRRVQVRCWGRSHQPASQWLALLRCGMMTCSAGEPISSRCYVNGRPPVFQTGNIGSSPMRRSNLGSFAGTREEGAEADGNRDADSTPPQPCFPHLGRTKPKASLTAGLCAGFRQGRTDNKKTSCPRARGWVGCGMDETPLPADNPEMLRWRRRFIFRQRWFSICSTHHHIKPDCGRCRCGHWVNMAKHHVGHVFYKLFPGLWRWWANRPNSASRRRLESWFPNLRG